MATADAHLRTEQPPVPAPPADDVATTDAAATDATVEAERPVTLSWAEQEVVDALRRLARAQSDLVDLESRAADATTPTFEAADVERLEQLQGQLTQARAKANGRFGRAAARERLDELEMAERLILDRMGVDSYREYRAAIEAPHVEAVDPQMLAFAQRELASAREAWLEVQALEIPAAEEAGELAPSPEPTPEIEIDLTAPPHVGGDVA